MSTVVYTFYATDADEGTNSDITYELIAPVSFEVRSSYHVDGSNSE